MLMTRSDFGNELTSITVSIQTLTMPLESSKTILHEPYT